MTSTTPSLTEYKDNTKRPVAVFDSGVGGISVLREMVKIMPYEDFIFYGDSKNAPYGTKSEEEVRRLTISHVENFLSEGVKAVAIACNTATSAAVRKIRIMHPSLPVVGIEPAVKPAAERHPGGRVLVMATPMTIHGEKFKKLMGRFQDMAEIIPLPCAGLMEYVEQGKTESPELLEFLRQLLWEYIKNPVDAVVLGCTHYPFARPMIRKVLGPKPEIIDGSLGTAHELKRRMELSGLLRTESSKKGSVVFRDSMMSEEKIALMKKLFTMQIEEK